MAKQIFVSFENETVKVLYTSSSRKYLEIHQALILKNNEFDDFLKREPARNFIVVCNFKTFHHDILFLPPAKDRYLKKIIESEIRKKHPDLKNFSFAVTALGETVREGKKGKEALYFAADNTELFQIISRFDRYGKTVKHIYAGVSALSMFVSSQFNTGENPALCIAESGLDKNLFLVKNGNPHFVRTVQALESGIHDLDINDLNMTANYCRQTLRISPSVIALIGSVCLKYEATMELAVPAVCIPLPRNIKSVPENIAEFMMPAAAALENRRLKSVDMLPQPYGTAIIQKKIVTYCAILLLVLFLSGLVYLKGKMTAISTTIKDIETIRAEIKQLEASRFSYETYNKELQKFIPLINYVNRISAFPDMQRALAGLSALRARQIDNVHIRSIDLNSGTGPLSVIIKGDITAEKLADLRRKYQKLTYEIKKIGGMEILNEKLDLKEKSFQIESRYNVK